MRTSFGNLSDRIYRLHITCPAGHTTYTDYATKRSAYLNYNKLRDTTTWYATRIEEIKAI